MEVSSIVYAMMVEDLQAEAGKKEIPIVNWTCGLILKPTQVREKSKID